MSFLETLLRDARLGNNNSREALLGELERRLGPFVRHARRTGGEVPGVGRIDPELRHASTRTICRELAGRLVSRLTVNRESPMADTVAG